MRHGLTPRPLLGAITLAGVCVLAACGSAEHDGAGGNGPAAAQPAPRTDYLVVVADPPLQREVRTATVTEAEFRERVSLDARVTAPSSGTTAVRPVVAGRVVRVAAGVGQAVSRGQILAEIESPALVALQQDYLEALGARSRAQQAVREATRLFESDVMTAGEVRAREGLLDAARADVQAAHERLAASGVDESTVLALERGGAPDPRSYVVAPTAGHVIDVLATAGGTAGAEDILFVVASLDTVTIEATVPPSHNAPVPVPGETVTCRVTTRPDAPCHGVIESVTSGMDHAMPRGTIRIRAPNAARALLPGTPVTVSFLDRPRRHASIPGSAVLREGVRDYVFRQDAAGTFRLVPVYLGDGDGAGGTRPVLEGLASGDTVVTAGVEALSEARKRRL